MKLFDDLIRGGTPAVRALVGKHETLELDFKCKSPAGSKDDKRVLAKALSAFANSMGGLIVWGVDCRKDQNGVDEVVGFNPIQGLARFASDMRDWSVEAVMPRLTAVRVEALDEGNDTGFLLIDVDRSERRPHRCEIGDKLYYRRSGASSRAMEHFEIEDAFRRASRPEMELEYRVDEGGSTQTGQTASCHVVLSFSLRNISQISARSAYITVFQNFTPASEIAQKSGITVRRQPPNLFFELENSAIHPGTARLVAPIQLNFTLHAHLDAWIAKRRQIPIKIAVGFGCADVPMRAEDIRLTEEMIGMRLGQRPVWID